MANRTHDSWGRFGFILYSIEKNNIEICTMQSDAQKHNKDALQWFKSLI